MSWIGADDGMIQRGTWLKSTNHDLSAFGEGSDERSLVEDSDDGSDKEGSEDSFQKLHRRPHGPPASERPESLIKEPIESAVIPVPELEEETSYPSSKKKSKKSIIAAKWGAFE